MNQFVKCKFIRNYFDMKIFSFFISDSDSELNVTISTNNILDSSAGENKQFEDVIDMSSQIKQ